MGHIRNNVIHSHQTPPPPNAHHPQKCAIAARFKKPYLPNQQKNFPQEHPPVHCESNLRTERAGALGGSSREVREVWRVGTPLRKRGSCASKVFLTLPLIQTFIGRSRVRSWIASAMCGARITSLESRSAIVRATRRMRPYPRALNPMRSYAARSRADASSST